MVIIKELTNKDGEVLKTKEGETLKEYKFELGDEFIPCVNSVYTNKREANKNGKKITITDYKIKCAFLDEETEEEKEYFVTLTKAQADTLNKKLGEGIEINQKIFKTYEYENDYGKQLGIGIRGSNKNRVSFKDLN